MAGVFPYAHGMLLMDEPTLLWLFQIPLGWVLRYFIMRWKWRILGGSGILILAFVLAMVGVSIAARFHDGPFDGALAIIAAGRAEP